MDDGIGAVLKALDESGLKKKTIVAFLSDNGGALQANASTNGPLRSGKGSMYEGALRVPFLVSWPGTLPAGKIADRPVVALDLPVTARHLAGAPLDGKLDGVNLMPFLAGDANSGPIHEALFWRSTSSKRTDIGIRCGDLKYVSNGDSEAIFNVSNDIAEAHPLSGGDATRLKALWEQWNKENRAPRFPGYSSYHLKVNAYYQKMMDEMSGDRD